MKKKKKKKIPFDLEEGLANDVSDLNAEKDDSRKEDGGNDFDDNLDLENFGKKKKKKKKFNFDELENSLPVESEEPSEGGAANDGAGEEGGNADEEYDLDVDFSKTKKKKKKKKDLDELVAEKLEEEVQINKENGELKIVLFERNYLDFLQFLMFHV